MPRSMPARLASVRSRVLSSLPEPAADALRRARAVARRTTGWWRRPAMPVLPRRSEAPTRLFVGPANFAGQGSAWARSAADHLEGVGARTMAVVGGAYQFPVDIPLSREAYRNVYCQDRLRRYLTSSFTHVLFEAGRPIMGTRYGATSGGDVRVLREAGLSTALVAHGSDVRLPSRHVQRHQWSPFAEQDDLVVRLEAQASRMGQLFNEFDGRTFVSTPDLLADVPRATWLPVVVEVDRWATDHPVLERSRPVVLHPPSNPRFKGTEYVDKAMGELEGRGLIEYRRVTGVSPEAMPALMADADIVLEQFVLGPYSVTSCEAMAAGRVVVANVDDDVRAHVLDTTGHELPVINADPDSLTDVVTKIIEDRSVGHEAAAAGVEFVRAVHDGRRSAEALRPWLAGE